MSGDELMHTPDEWAPLVLAKGPHDHKGHSEEKCVRCGWVMGHQPLNCQNNDTPHVFPSQLAEVERLRAEVADAMLGQEQVRTSVADELASVLASRAEWIEHAEAALAEVERLRSRGEGYPTMREAADEIVRLRAENLTLLHDTAFMTAEVDKFAGENYEQYCEIERLRVAGDTLATNLERIESIHHPLCAPNIAGSARIDNCACLLALAAWQEVRHEQ